MRIPRRARLRAVYAVPAPPGDRLFCMVVASRIGAVKIVELMTADRLTRYEQLWLSFFCLQGNVAKPAKLRRPVGLAWQHTRHGIPMILHILHFLMQIHESSALCQIGHAALDRPADRRQHGFVFAERLCIQFRITAADQKAGTAIRHHPVMDRRKVHQLCPEQL